jgi:PEGA domain
MCRSIVPALLILYPSMLISTVTAQDSAKPSQSAQTEAVAPPQSGSNSSAPKGFVLEDGTPLKLRINRTISSADAHVGDTVDFEVLDEVNVNGIVVIPKGGLAFATVTEAQAKRRMARGGKLDINIDYVKLVSGEKAALRAVKDMKGGGHTGAMVGGMVATSIVFFPAAPFFLFMHGKDITIPKGTEITAYANGDMKLELAKFQSASTVQQASGNVPGANSSTAKLQVDSNPSGADIEVDGSFVGNTPSEVQVAEGDHIVSVKKAGFNIWERKMKVSNGSNLHLAAELEKVAAQ